MAPTWETQKHFQAPSLDQPDFGHREHLGSEPADQSFHFLFLFLPLTFCNFLKLNRFKKTISKYINKKKIKAMGKMVDIRPLKEFLQLIVLELSLKQMKISIIR